MKPDVPCLNADWCFEVDRSSFNFGQPKNIGCLVLLGILEMDDFAPVWNKTKRKQAILVIITYIFHLWKRQANYITVQIKWNQNV